MSSLVDRHKVARVASELCETELLLKIHLHRCIPEAERMMVVVVALLGTELVLKKD